MKISSLICVAVIAYPLGLSAQPAQKIKVTVDLPNFESANAAVEWAGGQRSVASHGDPTDKQRVLMAGVLACEKARSMPDADDALKGRAALQEAEIFLQLDASRNAIKTLDSMPLSAYQAASVLDRTYERAGECDELMKLSTSGALQPYRNALKYTTDPRWRALIMYRAGLVAAKSGDTDAPALLEQAAALQTPGSLRGVHAQLELARVYARSAGERSRAEAWLRAGKDGLAKGPKGDPKDVESFLPAPTAGDLKAIASEAENLLKGH